MSKIRFIDLFTIIECSENMQFCRDNNVKAVPTWKIGNETIRKVLKWDELRKYTKC